MVVDRMMAREQKKRTLKEALKGESNEGVQHLQMLRSFSQFPPFQCL